LGVIPPWNGCIEAYNTHVFQILDVPSNFGRVIVVHPDFREAAYIVSPIEESWVGYAPMSAV
jgi:hypothetical protein